MKMAKMLCWCLRGLQSTTEETLDILYLPSSDLKTCLLPIIARWHLRQKEEEVTRMNKAEPKEASVERIW